PPAVLHSLPTRRSSDLSFRFSEDRTGGRSVPYLSTMGDVRGRAAEGGIPIRIFAATTIAAALLLLPHAGLAIGPGDFSGTWKLRSEEHTSELQSPDHLV